MTTLQILENCCMGEELLTLFLIATLCSVFLPLKTQRKLIGEFKNYCLGAQSCPALCDPWDGSPPGYCVHGIFQARILKLVAISSSKGSSQPRD